MSPHVVRSSSDIEAQAADFFQVLPDPLPSPQEYSTRLATLRNSLLTSDAHTPSMILQSANPYPLYIPPERLSELQELHGALYTALVEIVNNWWLTPAYQTAIPVSAKIERVLRGLVGKRNYVVGSWRPDVLVPDREGESLGACEINGRFAFNGFVAGQYVQDYLREEGSGKKDGHQLSTVDNIFSAFTSLFDEGKTLGLLKGREAGHCIHQFHRRFENSRFVNPGDLRLVSNESDYALTDDAGIVDQFALELHQDELEALDETVLCELSMRCFNDLRTVYFVHDKRMLGLVLRELDSLVSGGTLTTRQAEVLRRGIIETHLPGTEFFRKLLDQPAKKRQWLLKPCLLGKGEGIIFGKDVSEAVWKRLLKGQTAKNTSFQSYVLQRRVVQRRYHMLMNPIKDDQSPRQVKWNVVGTMLCINHHFLGSTSWRTSASDITAVARSGAYLPTVTKLGAFPQTWKADTTAAVDSQRSRALQVSPETNFIASSPECHGAPSKLVLEALQTHGIAIVQLGFPDPSSQYLLNIARALGQPIDHSASHGVLWDVKPNPEKRPEEAARSETANQFPWHTDCSFDTSPPRYFALHVIHADRFGGGTLKVIHVDTILQFLPHATVKTLQQPVFKINVPPEFRKDVENVVGALLTPEGKLRFRRDVVVPLTTDAQEALEKLDIAVERAESEGYARIMGPDAMKDGTVLCFDNARWLHARSDINDPERWLRRIRWGAELF